MIEYSYSGIKARQERREQKRKEDENGKEKKRCRCKHKVSGERGSSIVGTDVHIG